MKNILLKIKNLSLVTIAASLVIGLALLIWPDKSIAAVGILCGAALIALGVASLIAYFASDRSALLAVLAAVTIIAGIIVCVKYKSIVSILLFLFGMFITVSGAVDLFTSFYSKRFIPGLWGISTALSVITVIFGIIIMVDPTQSSIALVRLCGVGLLIYAIVDIIAYIEIKKAAKTVKEKFDGSEADVIETNANEVDGEQGE